MRIDILLELIILAIATIIFLKRVDEKEKDVGSNNINLYTITEGSIVNGLLITVIVAMLLLLSYNFITLFPKMLSNV